MADRVCQSTEVRFSGSVAMLRRDIVPTTTVQSSKGNPLRPRIGNVLKIRGTHAFVLRERACGRVG